MRSEPTNATTERLIRVPTGNNILLSQTLDIVNANEELHTLWNITNIHAIQRMGYTDHGPVHFQIVANIGLKITRLLIDHGVEMSVVKDFSLTNNHAELIVFLACILHDLGMSVARTGHEEFSIPLANTMMHEMLAFLSIKERTIVISETLHAIISHRRNGHPVTIEAGIVRIADALDMSGGRSRIPYDAGSINIHSISAQAIDKVEIHKGHDRPVSVVIHMNNSAGMFQVDELLKEKMTDSGIEQYMEIVAQVRGKTEKKLISDVKIRLKE
jgi:hypothetical protein